MSRTFVVSAAALLLAAPAVAQPAGGGSAPAATARTEFLAELQGFEARYVQLAEAMPAESYGWRPGDGVRSVAEVYMHIGAANFNLPRRLGTQPPEGFDVRTYERSMTDKAQVVEQLRRSFAHVRGAVSGLADADMEKTMPWFNDSTLTWRGFLLFMTRHYGEHLGQSIAYARVNGVVPPWNDG